MVGWGERWVGRSKIKIKDNLGQAKNQVKSVIGYKTK